MKRGENCKVKKISVDADGKISVKVEGLRYPLTDSRGPEIFLEAWDQGLAWTPEHFVPGVKYEGADVDGLLVDWVKEGRYYDIERVHV